MTTLEVDVKYSQIVVFITVPSLELGEQISQSLVSKKLAACVNIIPGIKSVYRWKGGIESDDENLLVAKTRAALLDEFIIDVEKIHPYEVPEIIALPIVAGSKDYLAWIEGETSRV